MNYRKLFKTVNDIMDVGMPILEFAVEVASLTSGKSSPISSMTSGRSSPVSLGSMTMGATSTMRKKDGSIDHRGHSDNDRTPAQKRGDASRHKA